MGEDREQRTEDAGQRSEVRGRMAEDRATEDNSHRRQLRAKADGGDAQGCRHRCRETISLVTTAPAPMTTWSQIVTGRIVAFVPTLTRLPSLVDRQSSGFPAGPPVTKQIVNKHRTMRNETVVADRDQLANERVGLNPASLSDHCSFLYFNERSDERFIADFATVEVCRLYHGHICAELYVDESRPYDCLTGFIWQNSDE